MKKVVLLVVFLVFLAVMIWTFVSNSEKSPVENNTEKSNPPAIPKLEPTARNEEFHEKDQAIEDDEMAAFERRIGRQFTEEEKRMKPPEMGWTAWGQFVHLHQVQSFKDGPVTFYGKVTDMEGKPLSGVSLTAKIRTYIDSIAEKFVKQTSTEVKQIQLVTDAEGRFSIIGENGTNLQIFDFTKEGYEVTGERKFWGGSFNPHVPQRHVPDPENPEIFTMRKVE